jgi:hypothetical protein
VAGDTTALPGVALPVSSGDDDGETIDMDLTSPPGPVRSYARPRQLARVSGCRPAKRWSPHFSFPCVGLAQRRVGAADKRAGVKSH